jgi:hypothetical protein
LESLSDIGSHDSKENGIEYEFKGSINQFSMSYGDKMFPSGKKSQVWEHFVGLISKIDHFDSFYWRKG